MLDTSDPQSRFIFEAARHEDEVLELAKLMTLLPTVQRQQLLTRIERPLASMRELNVKRFGGSDVIAKAIDALEQACGTIARFQSVESRLDGCGNCPVCGSTIIDLKDYPYSTPYCGTCLKPIDEPRALLEGDDGFQTVYI